MINFVILWLFQIVSAIACQQLFQDQKFTNQFQPNRAGRNLQTFQVMKQCFGTVATCIDGCFYKYVDRECRSDFVIPNIQGSASHAIVAEDYPYLVSFRKHRLDSFENPILGCKQHFCGGTLIWHDIVLTAAHCLEGLLDDTTTAPVKKFIQQIWATRASKCRHLDGIEEILASETIVHPEYDPFTLKNDIAMVFLRGEISDNFGFINFINSREYDTEGLAFIIGYGDTVLESDEIESIPARKASLQLISEKLCGELMPANDSVSRSILNYDQMLCAWNNQADTCNGDSGGPIFIQSDENGSILIGLSSWGPSTQCKTTVGEQPPSVFTRVSIFVDWIIQNIQNFSLNPNYPGIVVAFTTSIPNISVLSSTTPTPTPTASPVPVPVPQEYAANALAQCEILDNMDYYSNDLFPGVVVDSKYDCQKFCDKITNCNYFTYRKSTQQCWLKEQPLGLKQAFGFVSGQRCTPSDHIEVDVYSQCEILNNMDYYGNDLFPNVFEDSLYNCIVLCDTIADCKYFTFKNSTGQCWLKDFPKGLEANSDHVTGQRCSL